MGSRRIGLARTETLIENLKRALTLGTTTVSAASVTTTTGDVAMNAGTIHVKDGGTVTQGTSKTTGVTLSHHSGEIVMHDASLSAGAEAVFTLTNTKISATDMVLVNHASVGTAGAYLVQCVEVGSESAKIAVANVSGGGLGQAIKLNFAVIKIAHS